MGVVYETVGGGGGNQNMVEYGRVWGVGGVWAVSWVWEKKEDAWELCMTFKMVMRERKKEEERTGSFKEFVWLWEGC